MKKFFSWFGLMVFVFSLFFINTFSVAAANCKVQIIFDILDPATKKSINKSHAAYDKSVLLSVKLVPEISCSTAKILNVAIQQEFVDGTKKFFKQIPPDSSNQFFKGPVTTEYRYEQGVSGFYDFDSKSFVQPGGSVQLVASVILEGESTFRYSSSAWFDVDQSVKPIDPKPPVDAGPVTPKPTPKPKPTPDQPPANSGTPPVNPTNGNTNDGRPDNVSGIGNLGQGCDRLKKQFELVGGEVPEALAAQCGTVGGTINRIINLALGLAGSLAVLFIFLGGIRYLTAAGSETQAKSARGMMQWAVLGLVVIVLAFVIVRVVTSLLT